MKVIIAGGRDFPNTPGGLALVDAAIRDSGFLINTVVCGGAYGADACGLRWARMYEIPVVVMRPDWQRFGKSAGFRRNTQMGEFADALVALWDGKSKGTKHMIGLMEQLRKPVHVHIYTAVKI